MFPLHKSIVLFEKRDSIYVEPFVIPIPTSFILLESIPLLLNTLEATSGFYYRLEGEKIKEFELE